MMRFDPREAEVCPLAYVDARASKDPNGLARATADRLALAFDCRSDKPIVVGGATRWTAELMKASPR